MAGTREKDGLKARALGAMLSHAIFRLESALTIALTLVLVFLYPAPFHWWRWWYWLILGVAGEALIVVTSFGDAGTAQQVVADMLRQDYNPAEIQTGRLREQIGRALEYQQRIGELITRAPAGIMRDHLQSVVAGIGDWIANIYNLASRLDAYERDELIKSDMGTMQAALQQLEARLAREGDATVRAQLQEAIRGKRLQKDNLERLQNTMERAQLQLDATLTALGTVYSQLHLAGARDIDSAHSRHIGDSIREQVDGLNDLLAAMNEVYSGKA